MGVRSDGCAAPAGRACTSITARCLNWPFASVVDALMASSCALGLSGAWGAGQTGSRVRRAFDHPRNTQCPVGAGAGIAAFPVSAWADPIARLRPCGSGRVSQSRSVRFPKEPAIFGLSLALAPSIRWFSRSCDWLNHPIKAAFASRFPGKSAFSCFFAGLRFRLR